jgi:hypothetical protein
MKIVKEFKKLKRLALRGTKVTDAGVADLTGLDLMALYLEKTKVTDVALEHLKVTVHGQARGTDPFSRANGASESIFVHGSCLFFAVKMRQSPTRERLPSQGHVEHEEAHSVQVTLSRADRVGICRSSQRTNATRNSKCCSCRNKTAIDGK